LAVGCSALLDGASACRVRVSARPSFTISLRCARSKSLLSLDRTDQRRAHRLGQSEEAQRAVTAKAAGQSLVRHFFEAFGRLIEEILNHGNRKTFLSP